MSNNLQSTHTCLISKELPEEYYVEFRVVGKDRNVITNFTKGKWVAWDECRKQLAIDYNKKNGTNIGYESVIIMVLKKL